MADFSCPCCRKNLRKWNSKSRIVPWWKALPHEFSYKANLYRCSCCQAVVERRYWSKAAFIRVTGILTAAVAGLISISLGYKGVPFVYWVTIGVGLGSLIEIFEEIFSDRPAFVTCET